VIARLTANVCRLLVCLAFLGAWLAPSFAQQERAQNKAVTTASSPVSRIEKVGVTPQADGVTIRVGTSVTPVTDRVASPDRLVFDFAGCELGGGNRRIQVERGSIKAVRLSQFSVQPPVTRLVVDMKEALDFKVEQSGGEIVIGISFSKIGTEPPGHVPETVVAKPQSIRVPETAVAKPSGIPISPPVSPPPRKQNEKPKAATAQLRASVQVGAARAQTGAYSLMAKAKALTVADLQQLEDNAAAGDAEAQTMLALAYHAGILLKRDDAEALRLLHKAANHDSAAHGSVAAEESLGIFAATGVGMEKPAPVEALQWYAKAAEHGSMDAATDIALMYANGNGVTKDVAQAVKWFRRAAEGGDASAQYDLALMYERGDGVPLDYREAIHWLSAAAEQNLVPAMLDLAEILFQPPNHAVPRNVGRAIEYYRKAAALGNVMAQTNLGTIFTKGLDGKVDYAEGAKWYEKAAEQGDADAELGLGASYALGHGKPVNYEEARRWFSAAAAQGKVEAQYALGLMYEEGKGAPADSKLAAHYYQIAAEKGMVKAQYHCGLLLMKDAGSGSDRVAAYKWLMLAGDSLQEVSPTLSDLRKSMSPREIAEAEQEVDQWRAANRLSGK
jgi:TPR repeat protein